ncbi:MAG: hypothetical protein CTY38_03100 [Methylotenera sp.]|jgi:hypothetical protein|uniref:CRISPR system precrRNA processing endoribonuclease RAMP protein Cas6 n=1 Tax=Methylotenera sp. TaxID=2051956 RepID=UPI000D45D904|nr:CRISPR system precrRNA processing endoribonuclease RAMP protein Cas6 [Methylotenera sp.]PPC84002.1 MAG: hypothetical protein CTY38_03100 [Methylotenera sp.]
MTSLSIARYQFDFTVESEIHLPQYPTSSLRGVYGHALRKLTCMTKAKTCNGCPLKAQCAYINLFEPVAKTEQTVKLEKPPVPFMVHETIQKKQHFKAGETLSFGMTLLGQYAIHHLPIITMAWQQALANGIGYTQGTATLQQVQAINAGQSTPIYQPKGTLLPHKQETTLTDKVPSNNITLEFVTPLRLQSNSKRLQLSQLQAQNLLTATIRRVSMLEHTHSIGFSTSAEQAKTLKAISEKISLIHNLKWKEWKRYSNRQQREMQLGGYIGKIQLTGELAPFLPYLQIGQHTHIGKETVFGLGQYQLVS